MKKHSMIALGLTCLLGSVTQSDIAKGATIENDFGLIDPTTTITFGEITFPDGTLITDQYFSFGVEVSPLLFYISFFEPPLFPNIGTEALGNFAVFEEFSFQFPNPINAATISLGAESSPSNPTLATVTAFLEGSMIESFQTLTFQSRPDNFFGFEDILFDELHITLQSSNPGVIPNALVGEVQLGDEVLPPMREVAEPTSIISLLIIGGGSALSFRHKSQE